jgi:hypothetical protein
MHFLQGLSKLRPLGEFRVFRVRGLLKLFSRNFLAFRHTQRLMQGPRMPDGPTDPLLRFLMPFARVTAFSAATGLTVKG